MCLCQNLLNLLSADDCRGRLKLSEGIEVSINKFLAFSDSQTSEMFCSVASRLTHSLIEISFSLQRWHIVVTDQIIFISCFLCIWLSVTQSVSDSHKFSLLRCTCVRVWRVLMLRIKECLWQNFLSTLSWWLLEGTWTLKRWKTGVNNMSLISVLMIRLWDWY